MKPLFDYLRAVLDFQIEKWYHDRPKSPLTYIGTVEAVTVYNRDKEDQYQIETRYILFIDSREKRFVKKTGLDQTHGMSPYAKSQIHAVEVWLHGGKVPDRINIDLSEFVQKAVREIKNEKTPTEPVPKIEKLDDNVIKFTTEKVKDD